MTARPSNLTTVGSVISTTMEVRRGPTLALLTLALLASCNALDAAPSASDMPSGAKPPEPMERKPNFLLRTVQRAIVPPITAFREAPPITRSWVSASVLMAVLASQRAIDLRSICFSERDVIYKGEWWRLLVNFFYMGDSVKSLFFWFQLHQFWECLKVLELVKYRWEPGDFIKMIEGRISKATIIIDSGQPCGIPHRRLKPCPSHPETPLCLASASRYLRYANSTPIGMLAMRRPLCTSWRTC